MYRDEHTVKAKKHKRKEIMAKIFHKFSDALKEYATPSSEKKMTKKIKKASKSFSSLVLKTKK